METFIIATKNQGKVKEFRELFAKYNIQTVGLEELDKDIPDVEETGATFEENAALKAETISSLLEIPVLADDSGLEIDALHKAPGVYSARYAGEDKNDQRNLEKVLEEMSDKENRAARFVCVLALAIPGQETVLKRGTCEGSILYHSKGENGFGYDPVFQPQGYEVSMAQLTAEEKNAISHRADALRQMEEFIQSNRV